MSETAQKITINDHIEALYLRTDQIQPLYVRTEQLQNELEFLNRINATLTKRVAKLEDKNVSGK